MKLFIEKEEVNIPDKELDDLYLGEGSESTVYLHKKEALKIYKDNFYQKRLTEEESMKMKRILTQRIMLPRRIIYDKNKEFIGYTTPFKKEADLDFLNRITMEKFIEELKILQEDVRILSHEGIKLEDIHQNNLLISDGIYLCDPGLYRFTNMEYEGLYRENIIELNYLFTVLLIETSVFKLTNEQKDALEDYFGVSSRFFLDKLVEEQNINPNQQVKSFIRNLALSVI